MKLEAARKISPVGFSRWGAHLKWQTLYWVWLFSGWRWYLPRQLKLFKKKIYLVYFTQNTVSSSQSFHPDSTKSCRSLAVLWSSVFYKPAVASLSFLPWKYFGIDCFYNKIPTRTTKWEWKSQWGPESSSFPPTMALKYMRLLRNVL